VKCDWKTGMPEYGDGDRCHEPATRFYVWTNPWDGDLHLYRRCQRHRIGLAKENDRIQELPEQEWIVMGVQDS